MLTFSLLKPSYSLFLILHVTLKRIIIPIITYNLTSLHSSFLNLQIMVKKCDTTTSVLMQPWFFQRHTEDGSSSLQVLLDALNYQL